MTHRRPSTTTPRRANRPVDLAPPRFEARAPETIWATVIPWVDDNLRLLVQLAKPYQAHLSATTDDLKHEALLLAYECVTRLAARGALPDFRAYFLRAWQTHCRSGQHREVLAGSSTETEAAGLPLAAPAKPARQPEQHLDGRVATRLAALTRREREISEALLDWPGGSLAAFARAQGRPYITVYSAVRRAARHLERMELAA